MPGAYCNWLIARTLSLPMPKVKCTADTQISGWLNFSEYWSFRNGIPAAEWLFMERCLTKTPQEQPVAIDIGANIGFFTVALASVKNSVVHAFEPIPETFARLKANLVDNQLLEKVTLNPMAVGAEVGFVEFQKFENSPATNRLLIPGKSHPDASTTQRVRVTTLDHYCAEKNIKTIDFLKIDVEGMEPFVLQGAQALLKTRSISAMLLEICPDNLEMAGTSLAELYDVIAGVGYFPHILLSSGDIGSVLNQTELEHIRLANVAVIHSAK
jgi:FkbM family methyltransferase